MNTRNLQLSLFHLHIIVKDLGEIIVSIGNTDTLPLELFVPIVKYINIRTCAFYDEIEQQFLKIAISDEARFKKLEKIYSFILSKRDEYFPDLHKIRNLALAHNYRVKRGKIYCSIFDEPMHLVFPKYAVEISVNIHLMDSLLSAIKWLYPEIHQIMDENILNPTENMSSTMIAETNYQNILVEIDKNVQKIADE